MPVQMLLYLLLITGRREGGGMEGRGCPHGFAACFLFPPSVPPSLPPSLPSRLQDRVKSREMVREDRRVSQDGREPKQPLTCC